MKFAIRAENLSKQYRIQDAKEPVAYRTLRDDLVRWASIPFRGFDRTTTHEFWALRDLNFQVQTGEVLGVIGSNGAGKSTLLKIISRITKPTAGRVRLRGRVASLLEVGTGFHPELTGRENIYLSGAILGMTRREIDRKFDAIVDFSGVPDFLDTPVKRYSSGMNLRLGFAVAAHVDPEILIVDEVLAVGDAEFQRRCLAKMEEKAAGQNRTILFVSHNLAAVRQLCQRVIWLDHGCLRMCGPAAAVIDAYASHESRQPAAA
jgi:lipopolysaccharide transport system ATP-binding protein